MSSLSDQRAILNRGPPPRGDSSMAILRATHSVPTRERLSPGVGCATVHHCHRDPHDHSEATYQRVRWGHNRRGGVVMVRAEGFQSANWNAPDPAAAER